MEAELPLFGEPERINDPQRALSVLAEQCQACTRCDLYKHATQAVFGEGPAAASLLLVGEQPGDQEDLAGHPFVGPAGKVLNSALERAGIPREETYVTNAVKHFKHEPRGKRRLHKKPDASEIDACRWWLDKELRIVRPKIAIALGATAARALTGKSASIKSTRGKVLPLPEPGLKAVVTVHPSYLLRIRDHGDKEREFAAFVADLKFAAGKAKIALA